VLQENSELHLQSSTGQHIKLAKEELTKTTRDLNGLNERVQDRLKNKNGERWVALENKVNAVEGRLEKQIQTFKVELHNLHAGFEEKRMM